MGKAKKSEKSEKSGKAAKSGKVAKDGKAGKAGPAAKDGKVAKDGKAGMAAKATKPAVPGYADDELRGKAKEKAADAKAEAEQALRDEAVETTSWSQLLRVGPDVDLSAIDTRSTPGFDGGKRDGKALTVDLQARLGDLQERLYAESRSGGTRAVLLVIQGMDTAGKGGIMRHVVGSVDPQGVDITSFKAPTAEEREHPFLWRIRRALPRAGQIGVFDRSHYEDVLIVRVHDLVPRATWSRRYAQINRFEAGVVESGTPIVKVMLHVSSQEQKARLAERLERRDKHWKYNPADVDERLLWDDYMEAYEAALSRCSTEAAPWHVVPADRKWYARLAVTTLLLEHLEAMNPLWPEADFDVEAEKARLAATP